MLSLAACECVPPRNSAARIELRARLQPLIHRSQCPGPPTPQAFEARQADLARRKDALIERVGRSPVAKDIAQVIREDEEAYRFANESDCALPFWNEPEAPANVAAWPARLEAERQALRAAEAAFTRVLARCNAL